MIAQPNTHIDLRAPVIVLILAATAVPVGIKPPGPFDFSFQSADFLENVVGYVPVGLALGALTPVRAVLIAGLISLFAEVSQCVMMQRDPSLMDVLANVIGAAAGTAAAARWRIRPLVPLRRWLTLSAAVLAASLAAMLAAMLAATVPRLNPRGATIPGMLEAYWMFDEPDGNPVLDSSSHNLQGTLQGGARRAPGIRGRAIALDGVDGSVNLGWPMELRLTGSLTVSAWIKASSNPVDDAAIISSLHDVALYTTGFQLDTTIDSGPRTIGFKMGDACGRYFARYGATALQLGTWYYVTGVYSARARTIDVYLDGKPDNGQQMGAVPDARRSSREDLYIGQRGYMTKFNFAGLVDDVRIYSRALTNDEIVADMSGTKPTAVVPASDANVKQNSDGQIQQVPGPRCSQSGQSMEEVRPEEARLPAPVAVLGMLICIAALGFGRVLGPIIGVALSAVSGLLLFRAITPALPSFNAWTFPLTAVVAAVSVIVSVRIPKAE